MKPNLVGSSMGVALALALTLAMVLIACGNETTTSVTAEDTPQLHPNLPPIPKVPPPRHKIQYEDGTWSVYGLRKRIDQTINEEVRVKAYVVKIFHPEPCPEGRTCPPPPMPHLWLGDDLDETNEAKLLRVVGYAQSQEEMDEAREEAEKARKLHREPEEPPPGAPPLVWDWQVGKRYIVKGRFVRSSGTGFAFSEGLLEYEEHQCLDCPSEDENDDHH